MRQPATTTDIRRDLVGLLPRLRRFAITLAGETAAADELVQAVCLRAISKDISGMAKAGWKAGSIRLPASNGPMTAASASRVRSHGAM